MALALGCLIEKWPWPWGACWERCLEGLGGFWIVWKVLEGVWRVWTVLECLEGFGAFAGWQTAALKANRKPLLWPWALALGCLFEKWPRPWGACWGRCLDGLEGFGEFGRFWRVFGGFDGLGGFGGFRSVWSVRAGKRKL